MYCIGTDIQCCFMMYFEKIINMTRTRRGKQACRQEVENRGISVEIFKFEITDIETEDYIESRISK